MKPGDLVIHKQSRRRLTVKATNGSAMVLCGWMEKNARDEPVECSAAFGWEDLRSPTPAEIAGVPAPAAMPDTEDETEPADAKTSEVTAAEAAAADQPPHKRKGKQ